MIRIAIFTVPAIWIVLTQGLSQERGETFEEVTLRGKADNAVPQVRLSIKAVEKELILRCRWVDSYGYAYEIESKLKGEVWKRLRPIVLASAKFENAEASVSHATNWEFRLRAGGEDHQFTIRGEDHLGDHRYKSLIAALLDARDQTLAFAKRIDPMPIEPGRDLREGGEGTVRRLLIPSRARSQADYFSADSTGCHEVLLAGSFLNLEVIDSLVAVLAKGNPTKAAAACAALAWISGRPASDDSKAWKDWWASERGQWSPKVEPLGIGRVGNGTVRALAGGLAGFDDIELDAQGDVWALADQVYRLDAKTDAWKADGRIATAETSYVPGNRFDFLRRIAKAGISVELQHDGLAVSGDGKTGVAVMGTEDNQRFNCVLGLFDFEKGTWKRAVETTNQFGDPVPNADGSVVAVAEAWGWANPNGVVLYDTVGGKRVSTPEIPKAETLYPIGWASGAFYFFRDEVESDREGNFEIWKHAVAENKSGAGPDAAKAVPVLGWLPHPNARRLKGISRLGQEGNGPRAVRLGND